MSSVIKGVTSAIVYSPLVLLCFTIIFIIGYGIYHFKQESTLPDSYLRTIDIIKYILTKLILVPLKFILQLFWFIIPIFPLKRVEFGYSKWGAWDSTSNNRQFSFTILFIVLFCSLIYYIFNNGYPDFLIDYSSYLNYILIAIGFICLATFFVKFTKNLSQDYPSASSNAEKDSWLYKNSSRYLYLLISVGVAMGILAALAFLVSKNILFSVSGSVIIMISVVIGLLFLVYNNLIGSGNFKILLKKNPIMNVLFYAIFIIPCIFFDIVKFLYNELRHTPKTVYFILIFEIILITLLVIVPIFTKYMYTNTLGTKDRKIILDNKIKEAEKSLTQMKKRLQSLKKNSHSENGKRIPDEGWEQIKKRDLNNPDNYSDLVMFLINYGYSSSEMCENSMDKNKDDCKKAIEETIKLIQENAGEIFDLEHNIVEAKEYLEDLKKERNNKKKKEKAIVLLRKPVYLKTKKILGNHQDLKVVGNDIQYNYDYSISSWFFIRAQAPNYGDQYRKYTTILDYGGKPNISYNGLDNSLKITMNNGLNKKPIAYKIKDFPLQRWNNLVITYNGGTLDIFMNAQLVASFRNVLPYMTIDSVTVGDDNGIGGGVCNVLYFPVPMSKERIEANYNILKNNNPPII